MEEDYYHLLGVSSKASYSEIKRAFRRKAQETHPDTGGTAEKFKLVMEAFEVLSDSAKRADYDNLLGPQVFLALLDSDTAMVRNELRQADLDWIENYIREQLVCIRERIHHSPTGMYELSLRDREGCCVIGVKVAEEPDHSLVYQPVSINSTI